MPSINLGNIFDSGGKTVISGGSSGLDVESIVNSLVEAKRLPAVRLEGNIEDNQTKLDTLGTLSSLLESYRDAANFLRNPPGVGNAGDSVFSYRNATGGGNYIDASAAPGADVGSYSMSVDQLATHNTKVTETFALADPDTVAVGAGLPFNAGTLTLGAAEIDVEIEAGDTLAGIIAKINAVKDESFVQASAIKVSDGNYRLVLKTTETGTDYNYDLGIPTPPSLFDNAIFHMDANDIDGDGSYSNNPGADQPVAAPADITGNTTVAANGTTPNLDVDGVNTIATLDMNGGTGGYTVANTADINTGGPYAEKGFAFSFQTGADVTGLQTIYEQGGTGRSFGLYIDADPGNGNQPTLFAVAHNNNEWAPGEQSKVLNLGVVAANTNYNVALDFNATANPGANDPANTFTGYVNGAQVDQATGTMEMAAHTGGIGVGMMNGGAGLPDGTTSGATGNYFKGDINEVALFNQSLSADDVGEISTYFENKYVDPIATSTVLNVGFAVVEDAQDALVTIDGTQVTRQSNVINDLVDDVTFTLNAESPVGTDLNVTVAEDREIAKEAIMNLVDVYNQFRVFAAEQTETNDDGEVVDSAVLQRSTALRSLVNSIGNEIARAIGGLGDGFNELADIGITLDDYEGDDETPFVRNILQVDETALSNALASNFDDVRKIFEFDYTADDPNMVVFSRTNALNTNQITYNIDQTNGIYEATFDDGSGPQTVALDMSPLGGGGVSLTGPQGSAIEGLVVLYTDTADATVNMDVTQGIGDRFFNLMENALDEDDGLVATEISSLNDRNTRIEQDIARIDEMIEKFRESLLERFSALEAAISSVNSILQLLDAQAEARASN